MQGYYPPCGEVAVVLVLDAPSSAWRVIGLQLGRNDGSLDVSPVKESRCTATSSVETTTLELLPKKILVCAA
eukprot:scaffold80353_cov33-Tisochrysis_lutea.AAC.8